MCIQIRYIEPLYSFNFRRRKIPEKILEFERIEREPYEHTQSNRGNTNTIFCQLTDFRTKLINFDQTEWTRETRNFHEFSYRKKGKRKMIVPYLILNSVKLKLKSNAKSLKCQI